MFENFKNLYNPMVTVIHETLNVNLEVETDAIDISLSDLISELRKFERNNFTSEYQYKLEYDGVNALLFYSAGVYHLSDQYSNVEMTMEGSQYKFDASGIYTHHVGISRAMFEEFVERCDGNGDKYTFTQSGHIHEYKEIRLGKRAYKEFWSTMGYHEFNDILKYIGLFGLDIDTREKATHIVSNDLKTIKIPSPVLTSRGFRIYHIAKLLYSDIEPWEMKTLARGYRESDDVLLKMIQTILNKYQIGIQDMQRKHILETATSLYSALKSVKNAKTFYLNKTSEGDEINA